MIVYTDGSCIKNKYGGWAFCIVGEEEDTIVCGGENDTTNNRMELTAVIEVLKYIKIYNYPLTIYTDSQLTMYCAMGKWKRNKNKDLWEEYDKSSKDFNIKFEWVKAHNNDYYNELVDKNAYEQATEISKKQSMI